MDDQREEIIELNKSTYESLYERIAELERKLVEQDALLAEAIELIKENQSAYLQIEGVVTPQDKWLAKVRGAE